MRILLVCSAGMSTSLLVAAMQKAAAERGLAADILPLSASELPEQLPSASAVLVAPQMRHRFPQLSAAAQEAGVPIDLIPPQVYGLVNGPAALDLALQLAERAG
jgi:PTS system cellobiose-specific IIB component